jgi:hypothetical protein
MFGLIIYKFYQDSTSSEWNIFYNS